MPGRGANIRIILLNEMFHSAVGLTLLKKKKNHNKRGLRVLFVLLTTRQMNQVAPEGLDR